MATGTEISGRGEVMDKLLRLIKRWFIQMRKNYYRIDRPKKGHTLKT